MSLTERINSDLKDAMKSGDKLRLMTIRSLRAALLDLSKKGAGTPTPEEEIAAVMGAAKKRKESIDVYLRAGRDDLAGTEKAELEIIQSYLPAQMTESEALELVEALIARTGAKDAKDFGKVMPLAMKEMKGKMDGAVVQRLVRSRLGA